MERSFTGRWCKARTVCSATCSSAGRSIFEQPSAKCRGGAVLPAAKRSMERRHLVESQRKSDLRDGQGPSAKVRYRELVSQPVEHARVPRALVAESTLQGSRRQAQAARHLLQRRLPLGQRRGQLPTELVHQRSVARSTGALFQELAHELPQLLIAAGARAFELCGRKGDARALGAAPTHAAGPRAADTAALWTAVPFPAAFLAGAFFPAAFFGAGGPSISSVPASTGP